MDRRVFLIAAGLLAGGASSLTLGGCGEPTIPVIADPELVPPFDRALASRGRATYRLEGLGPRPLLERAEAGKGLLVVTREGRLADRLQRLAHVRLQNRWKLDIAGAPVHLLVTKGPGERAAIHLAEWLASEEAAPYLSGS